MKFTHTIPAFLLCFILASNISAQSVDLQEENQVASLSTAQTHQAARVFNVKIDQSGKKLMVEFEMTTDAAATIEVVSADGSSTQLMEELEYTTGMHNREFFIPHLLNAKYYCLVKSGNWVGAHGFTVEPEATVMEPILF